MKQILPSPGDWAVILRRPLVQRLLLVAMMFVLMGASCPVFPIENYQVQDDSVTTPINTAVTFNAAENDGLRSSSPNFTSNPQHGTLHQPVVTYGFGNIQTYTPDKDFVGVDTFTYQVCTEGGSVCSSATVTITVTAVCGDALCSSTESSTSCPADCGAPAACGDGTCSPSENATTCAEDCAYCGDHICSNTETLAMCAIDCSVCGDEVCSGSETLASCVQDCAACGDKTCNGPETSFTCPGDCGAPIVCGDGTCNGSENSTTCEKDCPKPVVCGDAVCNGAENPFTCAEDCGSCGNGVCDPGENHDNCSTDCAANQPPPPPSGPVCGNGACEAGEAGVCTADCGFD